MTHKGLADEINSVEYLYLRELSEPEENALRLVIEEAVANPSGQWQPHDGISGELANILRGASPIEPIEGCRTFQLYWKRYVAYLVTEECVGSCADDSDEVYEGKVLRHYSKSHFLDHLARDTGGHSRPLQHYRVSCLNHIIDVAAEDPPEITLIGTI